MDLSDNAQAPEARMLTKLEFLIDLLGEAYDLGVECLELVPESTGLEFVQLRLQATLDEARSELRAGRVVTPAEPEEIEDPYWPTEAAVAAIGR